MKSFIAHLVRHVPAVLLLVVCGDSLATEKPPRPDVLVIMPDQMRGDCLSILDHPAVRTPHLDALAREGALFRRAYTTVPSCIPARRALLTGLFPQTSGVVGYAGRPISSPTMPQLLGDAGYTTVLVGRNMHQIPRTASYGYQTRILGSTYDDGDDYDTYLKKVTAHTEGLRKLVADLGLSYNGWQAKPWPFADDQHPTAWIVRQARRILAESAADKPLFLTASFYAPHPPLFPPKKYFDHYYSANLPQPAHGDWVDWGALSPKGDRVGHRVLLEGEPLRAAQAGYFGLIEQLDDEIAPLVEEFKTRSSRIGRPWLIWVMADHGEMLGDHGYFRKCEPFEGSANIPFLISGSKELGFRPGLRSFRPVCLEDVMPTLLELGGGARPEVLDGVSLVPTLRGEDRVIRPWLHFEHATCYSEAQAFHALTDGRFKYIWRPADGTEHLFDLDNDLREEHDLSKDAAHRQTLETWRGTLTERLARRPEGFSDGDRLIPGRPYRPLHALRP
ncbi:MAG TPA: sulfatase-like hydrolase/transferase [Thermoguttaceae bacterium]|nr:sulfatase-like hydrolase/transferase [Thermoguttaceae bacterium]